MKKIIFTLWIASLAQAAFAQIQGQVIYERILTFGEASKSTFRLYFNPERSAFVEQNPLPAEQRVEHSGSEEMLEFNIRLGSGLPYAVFTDFPQKVIRSRTTGSGNKTIVVREDLSQIAWKIGEENKTIGSFVCRKARGSFRGRTYTAWFASDVATQSGPWKFNGLPGLILEIYDDKGEVYFGARSVKIPADFQSNELVLSEEGYKVLSLEEYVREKEGQVNEVLAALQAKLTRGSSINFSQQSVSAIETEFEFEKK